MDIKDKNMKKYIPLSILIIATPFIIGCTPKYVETSPIMKYNLTNVNISQLRSHKLCTTSESRDVSIPAIAKAANFKYVYAIDREEEWQSHLWGPDTIEQICVTAYGTAYDKRTDTNSTH